MHSVIDNNYKNIIRECFSSDNDLINKWHIESGTNLDNCVNRTYKDMKECESIKVHILYDNNKICGYFGKEYLFGLNFLTGFFLKPNYRNKEYIKEFWNIVNKEFNNNIFFTGIYEKNIPAINFLKRNGGKEISKINECNGLVFMLNGDNVCR